MIAAVEDNAEQFEQMAEPIIKLLVAKSVEQAVEEARQEHQLLVLHMRKRELIRHQEEELRELEREEARRHLLAQQAMRGQLIV